MLEKNISNRLSPKGKIFFQLFIRFLKENHCFYNYKKAFEEYKRINKLDWLILCCNKLSPAIIDETLNWAGTEEGFDYWAHVHCQFQSLWSFIEKILDCYDGKIYI